MKQKILIRLPMNDDKSRHKALKTVVDISKHLEYVALTGAEKNQVEVVGEGIDAVVIMRALRKKLAHADLVSVMEDKKPEKKKDEKEEKNETSKKVETEKKNEASVPSYDPHCNCHHYAVHVDREPSYGPCCPIM